MTDPATIESLKKAMAICRREKESLSQEVADYRASIEEIEDGYAEIGPDGRVTFYNHSFLRIFGLTDRDMAESDPRDLIEAEGLRTTSKMYLEVYKTGIPAKGIINRIILKDGTQRILETSVTLKTNKNGFVGGTRCIVRDITKRKLAEEAVAINRNRLEAIFQSVNDAIITVDQKMRVTEANRAAKSICGRSRNEIAGKVFENGLIHCEKGCLKVLTDVLTTKKVVRDRQIECRYKNNLQQVVMVTASPLLDHDSRFMGAVMVLRDISRLSTLENELTERYQFQNMIGKSERMQEIYALLENLSDIETTVLVTGESGTGKEMATKALHYCGNRKDRPLVKVNCSVLSENLLESELFGHVKGAFTGAVTDRIGRFQAAEGGTILLDEIGDISPQIQLKLLRVLEEKEFERVGESKPMRADARVIAATNRDLKQSVKNGEFREDLYYRLKVIEIHLPPLRERNEDIPLLVEYFCKQFNKTFNKRIEGVSTKVLDCFMHYPWPGNIRELRHSLERAFILCRDRTIVLDYLPSEIKESGNKKKSFFTEKPPITPQRIVDALNETHWDKSAAARLLGIHRATLYRKIAKYGLAELSSMDIKR